MEELAPRDEAELEEAIAWAVAREVPLAVEGEGSKRGFGHVVEAGRRLTTAAMRGVSLYEPAELVLTAGAGTPLREIQGLLDQQGQQLAFEPADYGAILGGPAGRGTLGGAVAINASGPRRIRAGAARDHVLGFRAVSGRGEPFKSGGRVMKNVTGYDLSKLMAGSHGTLGVMSEITVKVLPRPETEETVVFRGLDDAAAVALMTRASGLPTEVSGFAHAPDEGGRTGLRLEGPAVSVAGRRESLLKHFGGEAEVLADAASRAFWEEVRDVRMLAGRGEQLWRLSVAPADGAAVAARLAQAVLPVAGRLFDWAGGLLWLALEAGRHGAAVREGLAGHAACVRAPEAVRAAEPVFHPQPPALAALSRRVKESFDPKRILNPGRMGEGL
ncbi:MAG: glycolate oxidase subunit GlcE [Alphaproteobacteria bacterium]|nr:glycolate oxidase subunit GlcE [Alphaproteobacteria bacterium]